MYILFHIYDIVNAGRDREYVDAFPLCAVS